MAKLKVYVKNNQTEVKVPVGIRLLIRRCCQAVLSTEGYKENAEVSVSFVSNTEIKMYRTPYLIWTNYAVEHQDYGDFNASYLSSVLIDYLDLPKPNQYYVNMYMLQHYPINTRYEQQRKDSIEEEKMLDMMSIYSTIDNRFPREEMALPIWSVSE